MSSFSDPESVARYAEGPVRLVPGFHDLQRMASLLLAERCKTDARLLVLGAGGGLELKALAEWHPQWSFVGVDPSAEMLALAARTLGPLVTRVSLHEGYVDSAHFEAGSPSTRLEVAPVRRAKSYTGGASLSRSSTSSHSVFIASEPSAWRGHASGGRSQASSRPLSSGSLR